MYLITYVSLLQFVQYKTLYPYTFITGEGEEKKELTYNKQVS